MQKETSFFLMVRVVKRNLRTEGSKTSEWVKATRIDRIKAVETINRLGENEYAKQAFPRITRKAQG